MIEPAPRRIFIVEDEVLIAFEMSDILEDLGFEVVGPSVHIKDAVATAKEAEIDAAFLDVNLGGGMTSEEVAGILRERGIPFMFVTAYDAHQIEFRTSDDRVIRKPVTSAEVLNALRDFMPDTENEAL